jgi:hypothetical protein
MDAFDEYMRVLLAIAGIGQRSEQATGDAGPYFPVSLPASRPTI